MVPMFFQFLQLLSGLFRIECTVKRLSSSSGCKLSVADEKEKEGKRKR